MNGHARAVGREVRFVVNGRLPDWTQHVPRAIEPGELRIRSPQRLKRKDAVVGSGECPAVRESHDVLGQGHGASLEPPSTRVEPLREERVLGKAEEVTGRGVLDSGIDALVWNVLRDFGIETAEVDSRLAVFAHREEQKAIPIREKARIEGVRELSPFRIAKEHPRWVAA